MDKECMELVRYAYLKAKTLICDNRYKFDVLVDALLEKTTLYGGEFNDIMRNASDEDTST